MFFDLHVLPLKIWRNDAIWLAHICSKWVDPSHQPYTVYTFIFYIDIKCPYISKLTALPGFLSCFCAEKAVELEALHLKFSTSEQSEKLYLWINSWERRKVGQLKCLALGSIFTVFHDLCLVGSFWGRCWKKQLPTSRYFYSHGVWSSPEYVFQFVFLVAFCSHNIHRSKFQILVWFVGIEGTTALALSFEYKSFSIDWGDDQMQKSLNEHVLKHFDLLIFGRYYMC